MTRDPTAVRMQPSAWAEAAEVILRGGILADYAERKDELVLELGAQRGVALARAGRGLAGVPAQARGPRAARPRMSWALRSWPIYLPAWHAAPL